ncbi:pilus assembly protein [Sphingomonas parva]|uniref:Pilus assembly protein n=1 Tax=Sphingomonas parva TaxID=2555898 RepID=A0A4Y8ZRM2_9SPHN|nr:TadE/TadG family type IV pilus assembly protein [Sphingomonas parva]TFI58671.1 pilus assembly protein [Sphingomonas parva]
MRIFSSLRKNERGVTAVEFSVLALPLFVLIAGSIEFGVNMFAKANLDGTLREAARMSTTGDPAITGQNGELIDAFVRKRAAIVGNATVEIDKKFYDRLDQVGQPEKKLSGGAAPPYCWEDVNGNRRWDLDPGRAGTGGAEDIVNYRVNLSYPALFPLITNMVTDKDRLTLSSQISLRNEPFAGGTDLEIKTCCISAAEGNPVTCP